MEQILVPIDFSATAEKAARLALYLAAKTGATLTLYHIITPVDSTFVGTEDLRRQYNEGLRAEAGKGLERLKKKLQAISPAVAVQTAIGRMPLTATLLAYAREQAANLVVMGTQGASGLKKWLIGSVASGVAQDCTAPVLLVPEAYEWKEPEQFVFATNYAAWEQQPLEITLKWAQACGGRLTVVHLCKEDDQQEAEQFRTFAGALQRRFQAFPMQFKAIPCGELHETLEHLEEKIPYDVLVMVRRNRDLLDRLFSKSFTKQMACVTRYPLLVIPACPPEPARRSADRSADAHFPPLL
jgi:nucleotide-binding universal stress UspA family protein